MRTRLTEYCAPSQDATSWGCPFRRNDQPQDVASWEGAQYSVNLVRSSFSDILGLVVSSKRTNAQADVAIAEAVKLDEQEGPRREAERKKKQMDDLEVARQKNQKSFRP